MKKPIQFFHILIISLIMGACALPASVRPGLTARLIYPRAGLVEPLPEPDIFFFVEAVAPAENVTRMIFYANGLVIGEDSAPVAGGAVTTGILHWHPTEPGEYLVQAEVFRNDGSVFTAASRICILPAVSSNPEDSYYFRQLYGYTGPCEISPPDWSLPQDLDVNMIARSIPASLAYNFDCPAAPAGPTIAFEATLDDPSDRVVFVSITYSVPDRSGDGIHPDSMALNWTSSTVLGEKVFTGITDDLDLTLRENFQGDGGILTWTARAIDRDGQVLAEYGPNEILATPCAAAVISPPMPLVIEATETFTSTPTNTSTPTLIPYTPTKKPSNDGGDGDGGGSDGGGIPACKGLKEPECNATSGCTWDGSSCNVK